MAEGVKVSLSDVKDEIIIQGNDIQAVSQSAAAITDKCRVKDKDIRKFLDGEFHCCRQAALSPFASNTTNIRCLHVAKDNCRHRRVEDFWLVVGMGDWSFGRDHVTLHIHHGLAAYGLLAKVLDLGLGVDFEADSY